MITLQEFERLIPDQGIRDYITCGIDDDNLLSEVLDFVPLYQNIINLAFTYAFSCYLDLKNNSKDDVAPNLEECRKKGNANSQRVIRTMQHIYSKYPLSSELMQFVLSDIYYDFIQGDYACLKKFFPDCVSAGDYWCDKGVGLSDYFAFVNENAESSRVDKDPLGQPFTLETAAQHLRLLIGFFPFLSRTQLRYDASAGWYVFQIENYMGRVYRDGIIDTFGLIRKFGNKDRYFCFLSAIEPDALRYETPRQNKFIVCPMVGDDKEGSPTADGESLKKPFLIPCDHETVSSYFFVTDAAADVKKNEPGSALEQLFNINYKYMKNLALAIADIIGKKHYQIVGNRLKDVFEGKYPHAFESYTPENKNWDSIIIILLIEAGPTNVLREILYAMDDLGDDELLKNIKRRFGGMLTDPIARIEDADDFTEMAVEMLGGRYIRNAESSELLQYNRELVAKAKTQMILSAIAKAEQTSEPDPKDCFHTDDIQQYIILLDASRGDSPAKKCELVELALGDTLRRLISFYRGIFKYGKEKMKFDHASHKKLLSPAEIKQFQKNAEEAFLAEAKKSAEELKGVDSAVRLIELFVELCDECCRSEISVAQKRSAESRQLYAVLGKNYIMNKAAFEAILEGGAATGISESNVDWWLDTAISLLQFLSNGTASRVGSAPRLYSAIAPMVASYNNHNDSKDGYDTATFALIFDANEINGKSMEIHMLSEFSYEISMKYYCLPNIVRSNNKWWIDPLVIKCADFDSIFYEG